MNKKRAKNSPLIFLSFFYIKPQQLAGTKIQDYVALYLFSTSNHNAPPVSAPPPGVALYLFSTSNHNMFAKIANTTNVALYLFSTSNHNSDTATRHLPSLLYIFFLHQTTTCSWHGCPSPSCFISFFYIKPQPILIISLISIYLRIQKTIGSSLIDMNSCANLLKKF